MMKSIYCFVLLAAILSILSLNSILAQTTITEAKEEKTATNVEKQQLYPEMLISNWMNKEMQLEDFRGQLLAVIFYNDDSS